MHLQTPSLCQEYDPKSKEMSPKTNKDQEQTVPSYPIFDQDPTNQESYDDPLILLYSIHNDPLPSQEKSTFPSPIQHPMPNQYHDIPSIHNEKSAKPNVPIQNQEQSTNSNDPIPSQVQSIPSPSYPKQEHIISPNPDQDPSIPSSPCQNPPFLSQDSLSNEFTISPCDPNPST